MKTAGEQKKECVRVQMRDQLNQYIKQDGELRSVVTSNYPDERRDQDRYIDYGQQVACGIAVAAKRIKEANHIEYRPGPCQSNQNGQRRDQNCDAGDSCDFRRCV